MSLLAPAFLWLLSATGLVLLLHTLRARRRSARVSSTLLWESLFKELARESRWRRFLANLLLFLQLAALALLVLALAQPVWVQPAPAGKHVIAVLDVSASMLATDTPPNRLQVALGAVRSEADTALATPESRFSLVLAGPRPHVALQEATDLDVIGNRLDGLAGVHGLADWETAASLVDSLLTADEPTQVVIFSDRATDTDLAALFHPLAAVADIGFRGVGRADDNTAITAFSVQPASPGGGMYEVLITVENFGRTEREITLQLALEDEPLRRESLDLPAGSRRDLSYQLDIDNAGILQASLDDGGYLDIDDRAQVIIGEPDPPTVLVVGPTQRELQTALQSLPEIRVETTRSFHPDDVGRYDLIIFHRDGPQNIPPGNTLWLGHLPDEAQVGPALLSPDATAVTGWHRTHPLSRFVDWGSLQIQSSQSFHLPGADTLVEAAGQPLIQVRDDPTGRTIVAGFSPVDTDWPQRVAFPIFLSNLVEWVKPQAWNPVQTAGRPGEVYPLPLPTAAVDPISVTLPDGRRVEVPAEQARQGFPHTELTGVYQVQAGDAASRFAVNLLNRAASNIRPRAPVPEAQGPEQSPEAAGLMMETPLWRWTATAAAALLLLEGLLAGLPFLRRRFRNRGSTSTRPTGGVQGLGTSAGRGSEGMDPTNPFTRRRRVFYLLRIGVLALLLAAIGGVQWYVQEEGANVAFLLDVSASITPERQAEATAFLQAAAAQMQPADRAGLVVFGRQAFVESPLAEQLPTEGLRSVPDTDATNIEAALNLGAGMLASPPGGRLVLISDGHETTGAAASILPTLQQQGIPVDVYPLTGLPAGEVVMEPLLAPDRIPVDTPFTLRAVVQSSAAATGTLRVLRNGEVWAAREVELRPGGNLFTLLTEEPEGGIAHYEARIDTEIGQLTENNRAGALVVVEGPPRILLLTDDHAGADVLARALETQDMPVEIRPSAAAPTTPAGWQDYDTVILHDLPVRRLSWAQLGQLSQYVQRFGGGLVVSGGPLSYGPGGYFDTALDDILPVSSEAPRPLAMPSLALLFVLDTSGSMGMREGDATKLDLARDAILAAFDSLQDRDVVGVLNFDSDPNWAVDLQPAGNRREIAERLGELRPGGGTAIYPAMVAAYEALAATQAMVKHVVLLSDGISMPGDFQGITEQMLESRITVSTVAVGSDADIPLMTDMAAWGDGRVYVTEDSRTLPQIFASEALLLSRPLVKQETFHPEAGEGAAFLDGIDQGNLPPLHGYVITSPKQTAAIHLTTPDGEPVLASWRRGLGRVVAFTSSLGGEWAADWHAWPGFPQLAAQIARWTLRSAAAPGLHPTVEVRGEEGVLTVDALDEGGRFRNFLRLEAEVVGPNGEPRRLLLDQTGPGRYEARFTARDTGSYLVSVFDPEDPEGGEPHMVGTVVPYPAEYAMTGRGGTLLPAVTTATGGRTLSQGDQIFLPGSTDRQVAMDIWPILLLMAIGLFLADIAVRYVPIGTFTPVARMLRRLPWVGGSNLGGRGPDGIDPDRARGISGLSETNQPARLEDLVREQRDAPQAKPAARLSHDPAHAAHAYLARLRRDRKTGKDESPDG